MNCKVTISGAPGAKQIQTFGTLVPENGGFTLNYDIGNDHCLFTVRGGTATQSRRGEINMDITFLRGRSSVCMLLSGELTGSIPVNTVQYQTSLTEEGATANIVYYLGGAQITLRLSAQYVKEQL